MEVWLFDSLEEAEKENIRVKKEMNLPNYMEAFEIKVKDDLIFVYFDFELNKYINKEIIKIDLE
jgi:hypothetical protein